METDASPETTKMSPAQGKAQERGLSILWYGSGRSGPDLVYTVRIPPQIPKHNAKSDRLFLEAAPEKFCPPVIGDLRVTLHGEPVQSIGYKLPAPPQWRDEGRSAETWAQLNEPKNEYVVQLKLASEGPEQPWGVARLLLYVPNDVALGFLSKSEPKSVPAGWRPGKPVTISAILAI